MSLTISQFAHILLTLSLLLVFAHGFGFVFAQFRQPRVIGEILGGLLLGPTFFGYFLPGLQNAVFSSSDGATFPVLGAIYELGLLLLMFCSGLEVRSNFESGERKKAILITLVGTLIPLALGLAFFRLSDWTDLPFFDLTRFQGDAATDTSFLLVVAIAVAVTSIPVISRIMGDLGILGTGFSRIVLGVAVIEDIVLYIFLAIALALSAASLQEPVVGLQALLGIEHLSAAANAYHVITPLAFLGVSLRFGPALFQKLRAFRYNLVARGNSIAFLLVFMLLMTGVCVFIGIAPMFGAFAAGIVAGRTNDDSPHSRESIKSFAFAFFVPTYFAIVGFKLNLLQQFELGFFLFFLAFACLAKSLSVYWGARLGGEGPYGAANLAIALNARGGPGIVLASVAYDARIVDETMYAILVMLAIVTSLLAGSWLERLVSTGRPLR